MTAKVKKARIASLRATLAEWEGTGALRVGFWVSSVQTWFKQRHWQKRNPAFKSHRECRERVAHAIRLHRQDLQNYFNMCKELHALTAKKKASAV